MPQIDKLGLWACLDLCDNLQEAGIRTGTWDQQNYTFDMLVPEGSSGVVVRQQIYYLMLENLPFAIKNTCSSNASGWKLGRHNPSKIQSKSASRAARFLGAGLHVKAGPLWIMMVTREDGWRLPDVPGKVLRRLGPNFFNHFQSHFQQYRPSIWRRSKKGAT
eukprot:3631854-Amphidinium_carterae.4